jgi:uncharacterized protein YndB with AHSA1/START domain
MTAPIQPGDQVRVTVGVAVPPEEAFRVFTEEVNLWWRRGKRFRNAPGNAPGDTPEDAPSGAGIVHIEPRVGGRLFESFDTAAGEQVVEMGRVLVWQPPERLLLRWRASNFSPHEHTEVEVLFKAVNAGLRTQVTVTHRGWAAIRSDHPVRHGQPSAEFIRTMGLWWGDLLTTLRQRCQR